MDCNCPQLQQPAAAPGVVGPAAAPPLFVGGRDLDRKVLRDTLYSEIIQRHRRSIFALGSFLRMLKTKKSNYNWIL